MTNVRRWCATRIADDGEYGETFEATDAAHAKHICAERGWRLDGEIMAVIPAEQTTAQQMDAMCARRNDGVNADA